MVIPFAKFAGIVFALLPNEMKFTLGIFVSLTSGTLVELYSRFVTELPNGQLVGVLKSEAISTVLSDEGKALTSVFMLLPLHTTLLRFEHAAFVAHIDNQ